jgi:hypothetical protein
VLGGVFGFRSCHEEKMEVVCEKSSETYIHSFWLWNVISRFHILVNSFSGLECE